MATKRTGRKDGSDRIRDVVSLFGSLSRTGDSISIEAISQRLGVTIREAQALMDIICAASGTEGSSLPITSNEDGTEYTLQYAGSSGRPIRLTHAETIAVEHAFDLCGIAPDDPLRVRVTEGVASAGVVLEDIRRELGQGAGNENLVTCIWSEVEERVISFDYLGLKDSAPRSRRARVRSVRRTADTFYISALDCDLAQDRIFRLDRMSNVTLQEVMRLPTELCEPEVQYIGLDFFDKTYLTRFTWPEIRVLSEVDGVLHTKLPYYGQRSDWILRRLCACRGKVVCTDDSIQEAARKYAEELLNTEA